MTTKVATGLAVVFGGSRGIGKACCGDFISNGWKTVALARNEQNLIKLKEQLNSPNLICRSCDISNENQVNETIEHIEGSIGPIEILVNSAGITMNKLLIQSSTEEIRSILDTNLLGSMYTSRAAVRHMLKRRKGSIVNVASIAGSCGVTGLTAYASSKAGLVGFTKSLAKEVASRNIRVNTVSPGFIATDMTADIKLSAIESAIPLGRIGNVEEIASIITFLALQAHYVTGQNIVVDGGLSMKL